MKTIIKMITQLDNEFSQLNQRINQLNPSKLFILCDENTHSFCLPTLLANLETEIPFEILEIEPGEEMKTIETAIQLWEILAEYAADRKAIMINVGGGVITDLGGFVASTYKRGIRFINIPTTLLAMCDASIGGKTGIDHQFLKNIIGTFAQAEEIFYYPNFLQTLPFEQLRSGFAEMLKHGLIADVKHWEALTANREIRVENLSAQIGVSMQIKEHIVKADFKEENLRKTLNFGHTTGHALESLFIQAEKPIPHGEAVAIGMICETHLAYLEGLITSETSEKIISKITGYFPLHPITSFGNTQILSIMGHDKKNAGGKINFSLITGIGSCNFDYHCSLENIEKSLDFYRTYRVH